MIPFFILIMKELLFNGLPPVYIGTNIISSVSPFLKNNYSGSKIFILADENSNKYCWPLLKNKINNARLIRIKSGEKNKNISSVCHVWEQLTAGKADRKSLLINLGGGVVGDLGGFAASAFKRGIDFINIPTTLLAQVDASVGGKTGVDFYDGKKLIKNHIGLFSHPKAVFVNPAFTKTLKKREILSGFAEIIKHALIADNGYWRELQKISELSNYNYEKIICRSVEIKSGVVLKDPKESGLRKILNFGHTIGHALESHSLLNDRKPLIHGEAVAIGMICEAFISSRVAGLTLAELNEINFFIRAHYPFYVIDKRNYAALIALMRADKKNKNKAINFSLLPRIGECIFDINCDEKLITQALDFYRETHESARQ